MAARAGRVCEIARAIDDWSSTRRLVGIHIERDESPTAQGDDYEVAYEITFLPKSLEKTQLHVFVTTDGYTGVGIERWSRISNRLGVAVSGDRYAGGFEPRNLPDDDVVRICDLVCSGSFKIYAYHTFGRLMGCVLVMQYGAFKPRSFGVPSSFLLLGGLSKIGLIRETKLIYAGWETRDYAG